MVEATPSKRNDNGPPSSCGLPVAPQEGVEPGKPAPPPSVPELWLEWSCACLVQLATAAVGSWLRQPCHVQKPACHSALPLPRALAFFLLPFSDISWECWILLLLSSAYIMFPFISVWQSFFSCHLSESSNGKVIIFCCDFGCLS